MKKTFLSLLLLFLFFSVKVNALVRNCKCVGEENIDESVSVQCDVFLGQRGKIFPCEFGCFIDVFDNHGCRRAKVGDEGDDEFKPL
jgi:hypothetical protein